MAGPQLLLLGHKLKLVPLGEGLLHLIGSVPDNESDARGHQGSRSPDHAFDDRQPADPVQDLWQLRLHPSALPGGQYDDVYVGHVRGIQSIILA